MPMKYPETTNYVSMKACRRYAQAMFYREGP